MSKEEHCEHCNAVMEYMPCCGTSVCPVQDTHFPICDCEVME